MKVAIKIKSKNQNEEQEHGSGRYETCLVLTKEAVVCHASFVGGRGRSCQGDIDHDSRSSGDVGVMARLAGCMYRIVLTPYNTRLYEVVERSGAVDKKWLRHTPYS